MGDSYQTTNKFGDIMGGQNVLGSGASFNRNTLSAEQEEIRELIELLRREVDAHADEVPDPDAIRESADSLENELFEKDPPSRGTIRAMLAGMASAAGQVASVVDAIARIQRVVAPIL